MSERDFCFWLQGFMGISGKNCQLNPEQVKIIRDHLSLVFNKITPVYDNLPKYVQQEAILNTKYKDIDRQPLC